MRCHEKTEFLIRQFDPGIIWDSYGIRDDVVVSLHDVFTPLCYLRYFSLLHVTFPELIFTSS
jgi:hypothetical protein